MSHRFLLGMVIIFISGSLNGSFAFPMKHSRHWKWENTWLIFTTFSLLLIPWLLAWDFVPHLAALYATFPIRVLLIPMVFGFLWGLAQASFGVGIQMVGMALAFAVVSGLSCVSGSLAPLLAVSSRELFNPRGLLLLASIPILLISLVLYAIAGKRREKEQAEPSSASVHSRFMPGLAICIFTGILGSAWNLGFAFSGSILQQATASGATAVTATYAVWALVLIAGYIPNLIYCVFRLGQNKTSRLFIGHGAVREAGLGLAMAVLWLSGIVGYGIGASIAGQYGTSVGFTLFIAAQILASNLLGVLTGEWKSTSASTRRYLLAAVLGTLLTVSVLNLGGLF
jgi:L-rhamnose-H+ transport protein